LLKVELFSESRVSSDEKQNPAEITLFQSLCKIGTIEANWRMFQFQTFDVKPAVL